MNKQSLDERIDNLFEDTGSSTEDWYDVHTLYVEEPDIECIHLTPKAKKAIKQLLKDVITEVTPEKVIAKTESGYYEGTVVGYNDAIDQVHSNAKDLLND